MKLKPERLQRLYPPMSEDFENRMQEMLRRLPDQREERKMKRAAFRTVLAFSLVAILLCGTAFALIHQGLEWYYNNRFTAYQNHDPEKYAAILENLQTDIPQTPAAEDADILVSVQDAAWVAEQNFLVVSLAASPANPEKAELHPLWNLDADGAYVGEEGNPNPQSDGEDRATHWLWVENGKFGPVEEMIAPGKELLLIEMGEIFLDGRQLLGDGSSMDSYRDEEGNVYTVLEIQLDFMKPGYEAEMLQRMEASPEMKEYYQEMLEKNLYCKALIENDEDGVITLTAPYTLTRYSDDDTQLYQGGKKGEITFQLSIR